MMVLCLDFGNSLMKYAWLDEARFLEGGTIENLNLQSVTKICKRHEIDSIILSSVIHVSEEIIRALNKWAPLHLLSTQSNTRIDYPLYDKSTLGVDRIALVEGAELLYPGNNHFSICLGTCITYNWVKDGKFKAGAISPGLMLRTKSMNDYTAHLPLITPQLDFPNLGQDTPSNLLAGTMHGMLLEIKGYINEIREKDPSISILICGGDAPYFLDKLKECAVQYEPHLIWKGLYALAKLNVKS